jgi:polysaccharide deacetylase family protein (PEP-CTERM system associated)
VLEEIEHGEHQLAVFDRKVGVPPGIERVGIVGAGNEVLSFRHRWSLLCKGLKGSDGAVSSSAGDVTDLSTFHYTWHIIALGNHRLLTYIESMKHLRFLVNPLGRIEPTPPLQNGLSDSHVNDRIPVVLSFDVEEHHRIEAAAFLAVDLKMKGEYSDRMKRLTEWILGQLAERDISATFFIVGQIAEEYPCLVRSIHDSGHEVASHGWDHRRIHNLTPEAFHEDTRKSKVALEQATGAPVVGFRAPTFSIVRSTAWALDVLVELGFRYDSSIYPVRHDRYGVPDAPRCPFLAQGPRHEILELPPASVQVCGVNIPVGGGGYFRLLPSALMRAALSLSRRDPRCSATMLYFHPWEFDTDQPRLPLKRLSRFRTYVGIRRSQHRLVRLMTEYPFMRADDLACRLSQRRDELARFALATGQASGPARLLDDWGSSGMRN